MMLRTGVLAATLGCALGLGPSRELSSYSHDQYIREFGKTYSATERAQRARVFAANMARILEHNAQADKTWFADVNEFTDWTNDEFRAQRTGTMADFAGLSAAPTDSFVGDLPASVDWRSKSGVVTAVKNQGSCGSCWAFSAVETFESALALATGDAAPVLSEQQVVSCAPNPKKCGGTGGCQGATQAIAFQYTEAGLSTESEYPYKGSTGKCDSTKVKPVASNAGFVTLPTNNYTALATAVANKGPIAIGVAAGGFGWQLYGGGVYSGNCGWTVDHGVQLVGYGTDSGKDYWIVRNSWGAGWGESGYIRLQRFGEGKEPCGTDKKPADGFACAGQDQPIKYCGKCAILSFSTYPTGLKKL